MTMPTIFRPWLVPGALLFALLLAAGLWNRDHRQLLDAKRAAEAAQLKLKGQIVERDESAKDLRASVADLLAKNADLKVAYDAARTVAPDAKPIYAATLSTGSLVVKGEAEASLQNPRILSDGEVAGSAPVNRVEPVGPSAQSVSPGAAHLPRSTDGAPQSTGENPTTSTCVLSQGDQASISVQQVELQTKAGNIIAVGTAAAFRESPLPRTLLFGGPFTAAASDVAGLAAPAPKRWGAGLGAVCMVGGCDYGPVLALPPLHVFGFQVETQLGVLTGAHGLGGQGMAVVRW